MDMLNTARLLTNVCDQNNFDIVSTREIRSGTAPQDFYIQLYQSDLGLRYIPATGATLQIDFLRIETVAQIPASQTVSLAMVTPFAGDRSIWKVTIGSADINKIVSGGFRLTLVEGTNTSMLFIKSALVKVPNSEEIF